MDLAFTVNAEEEGMRLDVWLSSRLEGRSRTEIQKWIRSGLVQGPEDVVPSRKILQGESYSVQPPEPPAADITPVDLGLKLVYQDEQIAVVHKPPGLAVHPGPGDQGLTLAHGLLHAFRELGSGDWGTRPGIVHRLDKPTEGLLLVARNPAAHKNLSRQFHDRTVSKKYCAWLLSCPQSVKGEINAAIKRHPRERLRMRIDPTGRSAVTRYEVLETLVVQKGRNLHGRKFAFVEIDILTGRTHQIRVHMASIGCPVVGDDLYSRTSADFSQFGLLLLARELAFDHPVTGSRMSFRLDLPQRFLDFESYLKSRSAT